MRFSFAAFLVLFLVLVSTGTIAAQRPRTAAAPALPALSYSCIHHPDVLESKPGTCPICKLALVPVRLDGAWMCPVHTAVIESASGTCRLCRRTLIPVTVSLTWTCRDDRSEHLEPGNCADGSPRIGKRALRPHGNHNPQHGGQFFMAPDNWHHLEGAYPAQRVFRLYLYDDYGRPLAADKIRAVQARVVTKENFDPATRQTTDVLAFALKAVRNRPYLEARVDTAALPAEMTAKVRFANDQPEYRFDFTFEKLTKEPFVPLAPATQVAAAAAQPAATSAAPVTTAPSGPDPALTPLPIPSTMSGIVDQLKTRQRQVGDLVMRGDFSAVWVPAFQAKDLAIALEPHLAHLSDARRNVAEPAISAVVRTAWLLDAAGDVGNRQQIESAYGLFAAAVADLATAFEGL
ncbi:MAG TPA: heavy metal-binding domain-containing protein [Vicinamibacterales bacterium]|nr:heavy metal-binding domain-containing protein [Vicinamibacterales bacterium]